MTDLLTRFDGDAFLGDLTLDGRLLAEDDTIQTAVILSLFTDRRADTADRLPANDADRRGWWGDAVADVAGDRIGSRLWLLVREKQTTETLNRAREYCQEALQWLIDDGHARHITVEVEWVRRGLLGADIAIELTDGGRYREQFVQSLEGR